jgi:hypothetical protein
LKNSKYAYESGKFFGELMAWNGCSDKSQETLDNKETGGAKKTPL